MMNLIDEINDKTKSLGRHPLGTFDDCVIEDIKEVSVNGRVKYEINVRSKHGLQRVDVFAPNAAFEFSQTNRTQEDIKELYVGNMARFRRLYIDLGLAEPTAKDHVELEKVLAARLGEMVGRACKLTVQEDKKDPRYVRAYISKPTSKAGAKGKVGAAAPGDEIPSAFAASEPPNLNDIPF